MRSLLHKLGTYRTTSRRLEHIVTSKVDINRVLIRLPLSVVEQSTEGRVSESNSLVRTKRLSVVGVGRGPVESRTVRVQSVDGVGEVDVVPLLGGVVATLRDVRV